MSETTVTSDLLQSFKIFSELGFKTIGIDLRVLSVSDILLSIQKPIRDLKVARSSNDAHNLLNLFIGELSSPFVHVNVCLLTDQVRESSANSLNGSQCKHDFVLSIDVGIQNTE